MTRRKQKVAATRHAKHEWSPKRKALAVALSIALLGLGTPAVSFADSAADQQSKAVGAQETTSAVSTQEQAPASVEPAQQVVASAAALGGDAAVDNDVATDSKAEVDGAADNAAVPSSSENASSAVSKDGAFASASSDDPSSDKSSASDDKPSDSAEAASRDATERIEVTSDESGYYVYLYTKVVGNTAGLTLNANDNGWYTIGRVWVEGISEPTSYSTGYTTSGDDYNKVISALQDPSKVELYGVNTINLEDIDWSVENQPTGLKTASGAVDYDTSNNYTWHLDGYVDLDKVGFGFILFHYKDKDTDALIAKDRKVTAEVTGDFNFSKYIISIEGYTYVEAVPFQVVVEKNITKEVTLYYSKLPKRQIEMQAKSGTATYNGQEQSASGFESDTFEFDGVKYTVSGLIATAKGTDAGTYKSAVEGTAVVKDPKGNDVTAQFDVTAHGGELIIGKRVLTLTSASDEKPYDGNPLVRNSQADVAVAGDGFAEGEGAVYDITGSQTQAGSSKNWFAYELKGNTKAENYQIAKVEGDLTVKPVEAKVTVTVKGNTGTKPYSGAEQSVEGYTFVSADNPLYAEADVSFSGDAVAKGTDAGKYPMGLSAPQFSNANKNFANVEFVVEDGWLEITGGAIDQGKVSWTLDNLQKKYDGNTYRAGTATAVDGHGNALTVEYSADGESWTKDPAAITAKDYGDSKLIQLRATGPNYAEGEYAYSEEPEQLIIGKRVLTLTSASDEKPYDGNPLVRNSQADVAVAGDGFAEGEGAVYDITGSQTQAGSSKNWFAYELKGNTKAENYQIAKVEGDLTVKPVEAKVTVTVKGNTGTKPYSGAEQSVEGYTFVSADNPLYAEADVSFSGDAVAKGTDAGKYPMGLSAPQFSNANKNFANVEFVVEDGSIVIAPATLTVTTPNATRVYNGQPLTAEGTIEGFVNNETADFTTTGSQTAVGTSDNTYAIDWEAADATAKQSNYTIVEKLGTLKVTPNTTSIAVTPKGGTKVYDGTPLESAGIDEIAGLPKGFALTAEVVGSVTDAGYAKAAIKSFVITNAAGEDVTNQFANVATGEATLVVTPRPVTVASADATKVYNGTELVKHEAKVSDGELVEGEEFDYEFFGTQTDAGVSDNTFAVKPGNDATKLENYEIAYDRGVLTVTPAPYSVTTESATKVYDGTALTAGGKIEGLLEGETVNLKVTGSQTKVGASENTYTIEWTGTAKESNYKLESESIGTLTVTAAPDSPTPDDQSKDQGVFNDANSGLVQTGDAIGIYGMAAIIAAAVAAFVSLLAVRRRKE